MKIYSEINLCDFTPWSGAVDTFCRIYNADKCDELEAILEDLYPDGMSDTELNDLLWFESDAIYEWLGLRTEEQICEDLEDAKSRLEDFENKLSDYMENVEEDNLEDYEEDIRDIQNNIEEVKEEISELERELEDF